MKKVTINELHAGEILPLSLFSGNGVKLLRRGLKLTDRYLEAMQRNQTQELILAQGVEEMAEEGLLEQVGVEQLKAWTKAARSVVSKTGQLLIESGEVIEPHHLYAIRASGGGFMSRQEDPLAIYRTRVMVTDELAEQLRQEVKGMSFRIESVGEPYWLSRPAEVRQWPGVEELIREREAMVEQLRALYAHVEAGVTVPVGRFEEIVDGLLVRLAEHPQRFTQLALLCRREEDYLPDHAFATTVLALAVTVQMRWKKADVRLAGLAGLLYDLGMLLVPQRIRVGAEALSEVDRQRVNRHPLFALSMLQTVEGVPAMVKLAATQHHERENGSGYPFGLRKDGICDLARVLAVTDMFAAATAPRQYREPKLPYMVMEELIRSAGSMCAWKPAARGLVQAAGLFPVGSYVRLSDGRNGYVTACYANRSDRPVVQPVDGEGKLVGEAVDLTQYSVESLAIVRPLGKVG